MSAGLEDDQGIRGFLRSDLEATPSWAQGRRYWLLTDPLTRRVLRLSDRDYHQLASEEVVDADLLKEAAANQLISGASADRTQATSMRFNPLYIRFPGVDPEPVLRLLVPNSAWLFGARAIVFWMGVVLAGAITALVGWERFLTALPSFQAFFGPQNWMPLVATVVVTKVIHELAHATVCRRLGSRCPEIGVLLLCGTPCMYCDVTDSWSLPSRWHRMAVMLAGVYVEAILAAVATLVWWCTQPGTVQFICMNVMFVCGVSTLVFNLNPLMRFDGHYVLSDLLNVPNLRGRAQAAWRSVVVARIGGESYRKLAGGRPCRAMLLTSFHAAATCWRLFAVGAIGMWLFALADAANLRAVGFAMLFVLLMSVLVPTIRKLKSVAFGNGYWEQVNPMRRMSVVGSFVLLFGFGLLVPLPRRIESSGFVDFDGATSVYVRTGGTVLAVPFEFGDRVEVGSELVELEDIGTQRRRVALESQFRQASFRADSLRRRALSTPELMEGWDSSQASVAAIQERVKAVDREVDGLSLRSDVAGVVLPVFDESVDQSPVRLNGLVGQYLPRGARLLRIGDLNRLCVQLEIDAEERRYVDVGSVVRVNPAEFGAAAIACEVGAISEIEKLEGDEQIGEGKRFRVVCALPVGTSLIAGADVEARIVAPSEPLWSRISRGWRQTF